MLNSALFQTPRVEEILQEMGIKRFVSPLTYFRYAGGSFHCLTNEMYF
jgi:N-dimethylarginine dimethylaminohydrolase